MISAKDVAVVSSPLGLLDMSSPLGLLDKSWKGMIGFGANVVLSLLVELEAKDNAIAGLLGSAIDGLLGSAIDGAGSDAIGRIRTGSV